MKRFSIGYGDEDDVIEFNSFIDMLTVYKYYCSNVDCNELKFWMFNHQLISLSNYNHLKRDTFYINCSSLIQTIKKINETKGLAGYQTENLSKSESYQKVAEQII